MFNHIEGWLGVEAHVCSPPTTYDTENKLFIPELESVWRCHCGTLWQVFYKSGLNGILKLGFTRIHLPEIISEDHVTEGVEYVW